MKILIPILSILLWFCGLILHGKALVVSRGTLDVFNNPNLTTCEDNVRYCKERRAVCFGADCCRCRCEQEYSTFHSPGVNYEFKNGKPKYSFNGKETCVWNHYAHEGCRFIEESPSRSSRRFIPLINLNKNGTVHLKVMLDGVYQCNKYQIFTKRPKEYDWVGLQEDAGMFNTSWTESSDIFLKLKWQQQGPKYGGLMFKLNFTCQAALKESREPCIILKIKGTYDTKMNLSTEEIPTEPPTTRSTSRSELETSTSFSTTTRFLWQTSRFPSFITKPEVKAVIPSRKKSKPKRKMNPRNRTKSLGEAGKANDNNEDRGETFWILVYVFMAFAIFEVLCVALFFIYRHRRKRKKRDNTRANGTISNYDNEGMQETQASIINPPPPPSSNQEDIELYENDANEPRYSSIQQIQTSLKRDNSITLIENGIPASIIVPEQRSRQNSRVSQTRSIIVLPKDCVIVHASGSRKSRLSRRSTHGEGSQHDIGIYNNAGPASDADNRSLYSWESFSSCYRTSTDEDYVSGSNRVPWEEDSLYEEPDKVIQKGKSSMKTFGLERLFALQESAINNADYANDEDNKTLTDNPEENNSVEGEHIYESAEGFIPRDRSMSYYENAYDLPEDALAKCLGKPNKFALRHVLHVDNTEDHEDTPSLNLGMEFVNNNEEIIEGEDVKLRPTRRSTLYLHRTDDESDNIASSC